MGIADFFKQSLSSGPFSKKNKVDIYETPFDNLHVVTATPELADLQPKLEAKHKINKLRKLLDEARRGLRADLYRHPAGAQFLCSFGADRG